MYICVSGSILLLDPVLHSIHVSLRQTAAPEQSCQRNRFKVSSLSRIYCVTLSSDLIHDIHHI